MADEIAVAFEPVTFGGIYQDTEQGFEPVTFFGIHQEDEAVAAVEEAKRLRTLLGTGV